MALTIIDRRADREPPLQRSDHRHLLLDRRAVLKTAFGAIGAYAVTVSGVTWLVGPGRAWAIEFESFDQATADTLLSMCRALYPHEQVGDVYYAEVVKALDGEVAGADDPAASLVPFQEGVERLNAAGDGSFASLDADTKEAALEAESSSEFFQTVRGKVIGVLYNQPEVWTIFGYEGPSFDKGGYLFRGFDDLSWLPAPPAEASPPAQDA